MARARNIKPGLFKNEILGVADPLYTILFEGLWVLADRSGKLEDRPMRIKVEIFPYREKIDIDAMLNWLQTNGFIRRYAVAGKRYIVVLEFVKHQNPHKNETASVIPDPEEIETSTEIIGTETENPGSTRADVLIPDSPITDSLNPSTPLAPSELDATASPPGKVNGYEPIVVERIPLVDGSEFPVTQPMCDEFDRAYPAVDIPQTLREVRAWCLANPRQRKTKSGAMRFINSWLSREQNKPAR